MYIKGMSVCFSFPPASASYILLQFAQYGNILKHTVRHSHSCVFIVTENIALMYVIITLRDICV